MWNNIEIGFNDEETMNFGPRQEFEGGNALYEVQTLATISPSTEVTVNPLIICKSSEKFVSASVGQSLSVFSEECQELLLNLSFESSVSCLSWSNDSIFLLVGESNGTMHILYTPLMKIIFSVAIVENTSSSDESCVEDICFINRRDQGSSKIIVLDKFKKFHIFSNLNLTQLHRAIKEHNLDAVNQIKVGIHRTQYSFDDKCAVHYSNCLFGASQVLCNIELTSAGSGINSLCFWENVDLLQSKLTFTTGDVALQKVMVCSDGKYSLLLDSEGVLTVMCLRTLQLIKLLDDRQVKDFIILETRDEARFIECKIALLVNNYDDDDCTFELRSFPKYDLLYSLVVSSESVLVSSPHNQDNVYVVEGVGNNGQTCIDTIRIRAISEALPECRLIQMVHRRRFSAAEDFAKKFSLDIESVHKAHSSHIINSLSPWTVHSLPDNQIENLHRDLIYCLDNINDLDFIVNCCVRTCLTSIYETRNVLSYAQRRLKTEAEDCTKTDENSNEIVNLMSKVNCTVQRLETFDQAYGDDEFSNMWSTFSTACLTSEMLNRLRQSNLKVALTIWERHKVEFISENENIVTKFIETLPETISCIKLTPWFRNSFLMTVFQMCPNSIECIASWMISRAKDMELSAKAEWPCNAIDFLKSFPSVYGQLTDSTYNPDSLNFSSQLTLMSVQKRAIDEDSAIANLLALISNLEDILELKNKFKCKLSLAEYCQDDRMNVVFTILDVFPVVEDIPKILDNFLVRYMKEHNLSKDGVLHSYVQIILQNSNHSWWHWEEASWQNKALTIINCIQSLDFKLKSMLEVTKQAPVPWSVAIVDMVNEGCAINHPSACELKEQSHLVGLKSVLIKYGLRNFQLSNRKNAEKLMKFILKHDKDSAVYDAIEVVSAYNDLSPVDVYNFRLRYLIANNKMDEFHDLLRKIPSDVCPQCCSHLFNLTVSMLEEYHLNRKLVNLKCETLRFTSAALTALRILRSFPNRSDMVDDCCKQYENLHKIGSLQIEFDIFISMENFHDVRYTSSLLHQFLDQFLNSSKSFHKHFDEDRKESSKSMDSITFQQIFRFASLLNVSREETVCILISKYFARKNFALVIAMLKELLSSDIKNKPLVAEIIFKSLRTLLKNNSKDILQNLNIVSVLREIASRVIAYCNTDLLAQCTEICRWLSICCSLHEVSDEPPLQQQTLLKDPYAEWMCTTLYKDIGLRIKSSDVFPAIFEIMNLSKQQCPEFTGSGGSNECMEKFKALLLSLKTVSENLSHYLKDKNQDLMAYTCLLAVVNYTMNVSSFYSQHMNTEMKQELLSYFDFMQKEKNDISTSLLKKLIGSENIDHRLTFGLLLGMRKRNALSIIKNLSTQISADYSKQFDLAVIGSRLSEVLKLPNEIKDQFASLRNRSDWGHRLSRLGISFVEAFATDLLIHKRKILNEMVLRADINVNFLLEYCSVFEMDPNDALTMHFEGILLSANGYERLTVNQHLLKADQIFNEMTKSTNLVDLLQNIIDKIDFYNYESLKFTLQKLLILTESDEAETLETVKKDLKLLEALSVYQRTNPPSDYEVDEWSQREFSAAEIPEISKRRLPFHLLNGSDPWKIIRPELNLSTVDIWLSAAPRLKLSTNQMRIITVQNVISNWLKVNRVDRSTEQLEFCILDDHIKMKLKELINEISNPEMSTACANWVMQHLPKGPDKVSAALNASLLAGSWFDLKKDKASSNAYSKLKGTYQRLATEQILHQRNLMTAKNLSLMTKPVRLIFDLFERNRVGRFVCDSLKDVYRASESIADVNDCNFDKICMNLIEKWLPPPVLYDNGSDQTIDFKLTLSSLNEQRHEDRKEREENIRRAIYVLQHHGDRELKMAYLIQIALTDSAHVSYVLRYQSLRCLLSISDEATLTSQTKKSPSQLREYMESLLCVSQLESLHLPYTPSAFVQCDKTELVKGILRSHAHDPLALDLVSSLCFHYKIYLLPVWEIILKQMISFGMIQHLRNVTFQLVGIPELWLCASFLDAFDYLIKHPFRNVSGTLSDDQIKECFSCLHLFQKFPVLTEVDVDKLADSFVEVGMVSAGLACLARFQGNAETKRNKIEKFVENMKPEKILSDVARLENLDCDVLSSLSSAKQIVFDHVDRNCLYNDIPENLMELIRYLATNNRLQNVVGNLSSIRNKEVVDAVKVYQRNAFVES